MKRSSQAEEIEKLKAQIGDLEAILKKHKKDWNAYVAVQLDKACLNQKHHTPQPIDPREWIPWSIEMHKTHRSIMCSGCKRYEIWIPLRKRGVTAKHSREVAGNTTLRKHG